MRIISGICRGKKLIIPDNKFTRPLKDLVKESIFNLITHSNKITVDIENSIVLDLFSGSGSFGLECISRGASEVVFFENQKSILKVLKENIHSIDKYDKSWLYELDVFNFFLSEEKIYKKFDIIFLDPPYKEKRINIIIENILRKKILRENGIIIIHRHKNDKIEITNKLNIIDSRTYGISRIYLGI
jgi:16S rRNA (guanine966-N2)-methyltransferase